MPAFAPRLIPMGMPEEEQDGAWLVQSGLMSLESYVQDFAAALALFDFATSRRDVPHQWSFVAARDGVMTIYHFYAQFDGIRKTARACPTLERLVDWQQFRAVELLFRARFRDFVDMRDSIAHAGEKMKTPEKFAEHAFTGSIDSRLVKADNIMSITMTNCLENRKFTNTWEGKIVSYEVSAQTLGYLDEAKGRVWAAFTTAAEETRKAAFPRQPRTKKPDAPE